jgi:uncharacterized membrane protein YgdD (TMEM256/DUF423 family)
MNIWFRVASMFLMAGVGLGAFGAHGLKTRLSVESMQIYQTAVFYHLVHGLGIFAVAWAWSQRPAGFVRAAGWALCIGIVIFCGSLYLMALTGVRWLGAVTPIGGLAFILGWGILASKGNK